MNLFRRRSFANLAEIVRRHGLLRFARYLTPAKTLNIARAVYEHRRGVTRPLSRPFVLRLESTNICNLRCPSCPTGNRTNEVPWGSMGLSEYKSVIHGLAGSLVLARLDGLGEPTLNPHIWDMIRYAHERNVGTEISSHMGKVTDEEIPLLVDTGLDYLICSVDGATQETYSTYRQGGDLDRVLETIRKVIRYRRRRGAKNPFIEFQFIKFPHNAHEEERARRIAAELGVDRFLCKTAGGDEEDAQLLDPMRGPAYQVRMHGKVCFWPWYVLTLNWNGALNLCCIALGRETGLPRFDPSDLRASWHHPRLVEARALLAHHITKESLPEESQGLPCLTCEFYFPELPAQGAPHPAPRATSVPRGKRRLKLL